jgi:hypothetical protein
VDPGTSRYRPLSSEGVGLTSWLPECFVAPGPPSAEGVESTTRVWLPDCSFAAGSLSKAGVWVGLKSWGVPDRPADSLPGVGVGESPMPVLRRWLPASRAGSKPTSPAAAAAFLALSAAESTWLASTGEGGSLGGSAVLYSDAPAERIPGQNPDCRKRWLTRLGAGVFQSWGQSALLADSEYV